MKELYNRANSIFKVNMVEDYGFFTQSRGLTPNGLSCTLNNYANCDSCHLMLKYNDSEVIPVKDNRAEVVFTKSRDIHNTLSYIMNAGDGKTLGGFNDIGKASHVLAKVFRLILNYEDSVVITRNSCCNATAYTSNYELKFTMDIDKETCRVAFSSYKSADSGEIDDGVFITYPLNTRIDIVELVENLEKDFYGKVLQHRG